MEINMIKIKDHNHPNHHHHQDHHDIQLSKLQPSPKLPIAPPSPPSNASSPTHEFSFTISLHPNSAAAATAAAVPDKSKPTHDFSPADEIFFQGHLLPLHLLSSHLTPISPRASTNSLDSTLPLPINQTTAAAVDDGGDIKERTKSKSFSYGHPRRNPPESKHKPIKSKSFSFLGIPKWRTEKKQSNNNNNNQNQKSTKMKFDIGNMVKRYINMIRPLILSLRGKKDKSRILRHPHSFSGNLGGGGGGGGSRKGGGVNGRRDFSSAPASMRTSPGNSGLLAPAPPISSTSDSTMEELQAAIQAAIAHCKNSISMEEKIIKVK